MSRPVKLKFFQNSVSGGCTFVPLAETTLESLRVMCHRFGHLRNALFRMRPGVHELSHVPGYIIYHLADRLIPESMHAASLDPTHPDHDKAAAREARRTAIESVDLRLIYNGFHEKLPTHAPPGIKALPIRYVPPSTDLTSTGAPHDDSLRANVPHFLHPHVKTEQKRRGPKPRPLTDEDVIRKKKEKRELRMEREKEEFLKEAPGRMNMLKMMIRQCLTSKVHAENKQPMAFHRVSARYLTWLLDWSVEQKRARTGVAMAKVPTLGQFAEAIFAHSCAEVGIDPSTASVQEVKLSPKAWGFEFRGPAYDPTAPRMRLSGERSDKRREAKAAKEIQAALHPKPRLSERDRSPAPQPQIVLPPIHPDANESLGFPTPTPPAPIGLGATPAHVPKHSAPVQDVTPKTPSLMPDIARVDPEFAEMIGLIKPRT